MFSESSHPLDGRFVITYEKIHTYEHSLPGSAAASDGSSDDESGGEKDDMVSACFPEAESAASSTYASGFVRKQIGQNEARCLYKPR